MRISEYKEMNSKTQQCQNCRSSFEITDDDLGFYQKMDVPAPDLCPTCRSRERCAFRNESILHRRKCDLMGKDVISIYSAGSSFKVYDQDVWWSDAWDSLEYGREFDFGQPFFKQYQELMHSVPRLSIVNRNSENSDYCNYSNQNKNCYLCFGGHENENCAYSWYNWKDKDSLDCLSVIKSQLTYNSNYGNDLYNCAFLEYSFDCVDCNFGYDLVGCQNCFLCANLRRKQYCFRNQPLTKEAYAAKIREIWNGSYRQLQQNLAEFRGMKLQSLHPPTYQKNCSSCQGGDIMYSKNIIHGFDGEYSEDSKYVYPKFTQVFNCMDTNKMGYDRSDYCYMTIGCAGLNNCRFCDTCWGNHDLTYCNLCFSSCNLFGCIGLGKKNYCILSWQYSQEEYHELMPRIVTHMKQMREWGRYFPPSLSAFAYNETTAQEYYPLGRSGAVQLGYTWQEPDTRDYKPTLEPENLPDNIRAVPDTICSEIVACENHGRTGRCTTAFRITPQEIALYRRMNLPLPRLCSNCRHQERLEQRNPLQLWHRRCACGAARSDEQRAMSEGYQNSTQHFHGDKPCPNEFETSYAPERPEIVYCESCYNSEVA